MFKKNRLAIITIVYWFLLLYIIAALVFWYTELEKQNKQMINHQLSELKLDDPAFNDQYNALLNEQKRKSAQYAYEGVTFLALILSVSVFVYRAVRRQITLSEQQRNFMMAITHELKTPIAITKLNLETLQKHQLDEARRQKLIQMTLQEADRLNTLASNILVSSQLEQQRAVIKEELDLSDLIKSCVSDFMNRFPERNWEASIDPECELIGDSFLLQILVNNLLENAVKYSPPKSTVGCRLYQENDRLTLKISDQGSGVPDSEKKKVFHKFYRIGSEQTRSAKGTGLGLYLCKKIADDHKATLRIENNDPQGSVFIVRFDQKRKDA